MKRLSALAMCSVVACIVGLWVAPARCAEYSWQEPQAKVIETGDLEWAPRPFEFEAGETVRYIDYENGNDADPGTKARPWKHHPWDPAAKDRAAQSSGPITYVFKRGTIYRGRLVADESGEPDDPICLTSDPGWGEGEAALYGSRRITGGWTRCRAGDVPEHMPEPTKVWYRDIGTDWHPWALWELRGGEATRIPIARDPNWEISNPDDPQSEWYEWTGRIKGTGSIDTEHLTQEDPDFFEGGYVWTEWSGNMGTIHLAPIRGYDPDRHLLKAGNGSKGNRYYVENVPGFLDSPGEYYHAVDGPHAGRLYLRLPGDRDPNEAVLEGSAVKVPITIMDPANIEISGLRFSFNDVGDPGTGWPPSTHAPAIIRAAGNSRNINIHHCRFHHVMSVLTGYPRMNEQYTEIYLEDMLPWREDLLDEISITDCDIAYVDRPAISFRTGRMLGRIERPPVGYLGRIKVLRNRLYHIGSRPGDNIYSAIPAISALFPREAEIAGNMVNMAWGSGIFVFGGKASGAIGEAPLTRILIHHNKVTDAMLACNDYGGIEYWQGGPIYAFNNISGNSIGYKNYIDLSNHWKTVAYNMYLDGTFKSYTFNNIIWGKSNDLDYPYRNRGAYFVVLGFMDHFFNNTAHRFMHGIVGSSGNRSSFLGNVLDDISVSFIQQNRPGDTSLRGGGDTGAMGMRGMPTNAYGYNIFVGKAERGIGSARDVGGSTLEDWRSDLEQLGAFCAQTGWRAEGKTLRDPENHNFALTPDSSAQDRGVKFFVPWSLYGMVGEWNFYHHPADPGVVLGENFYMTEEFVERHMYSNVPRQNLEVPGASGEDYVEGDLEDWVEGALEFDGNSRYAVLTHEAMTTDRVYRHGVPEGKDRMARGEFPYEGEERKTVDMDFNDFLVEIYFRTLPGHTGGTLVSKMDGDTGYSVGVNPDGGVTLTIKSGGADDEVACGVPVNDGRWHHAIAEADRENGTLNIYVDGRRTRRAETADVADGASLSNTADFLVGRGPGGDFFAGAVDFLRVSRGTLADANTTIEELYAWQFDGPFLRDFAGREPVGRRDAGALEQAR